MPHDFERDLDGNMTLRETKEALQIEQNGGFQLEAVKFQTITDNGSVSLVNHAGFKDQLSSRLDELKIVEIDSDDDPQAVKRTNENAGWTFICDSQIFVKKLTKRVMIFGKNVFS